jgi:hypothetical protein
MAYFKDLTEYRLFGKPEPGVLNVGWLGEGQPFQTRDTSEAFRAALTKLCNDHAIRPCAGHHVCEICPGASWHDPYFHNMGNGEIRVRDAAGTWYAAPRLIIHYVDKHGYCPPQQFIDAVIGPTEIGKDEVPRLSDEARAAAARECDRRMRELKGPPLGEAEIDRIVRRGLRETRARKRWWRLW